MKIIAFLLHVEQIPASRMRHESSWVHIHGTNGSNVSKLFKRRFNYAVDWVSTIIPCTVKIPKLPTGRWASEEHVNTINDFEGEICVLSEHVRESLNRKLRASHSGMMKPFRVSDFLGDFLGKSKCLLAEKSFLCENHSALIWPEASERLRGCEKEFVNFE